MAAPNFERFRWHRILCWITILWVRVLSCLKYWNFIASELCSCAESGLWKSKTTATKCKNSKRYIWIDLWVIARGQRNRIDERKEAVNSVICIQSTSTSGIVRREDHIGLFFCALRWVAASTRSDFCLGEKREDRLVFHPKREDRKKEAPVVLFFRRCKPPNRWPGG